MKLFDVVQEEAPDHVFVVPGTCTQHRSANVIAPLAKILEIMCLFFCLSKAFHSAHFFFVCCEALDLVIAESPDVIKARMISSC